MRLAPDPSHRAALITGAVLLAVYLATAAPGLTFWDASEFATAIGTFGIPHPPGTPLYVALGTALWRLLPGVSPSIAGAALSALSTAAACAIAAALVARISGITRAGIIAGVSAGAMGTMWANATETEVYAVVLCASALQLALAHRAYTRDDDRARVLLCFIASLAAPIHLSLLVVTPAAVVLAMTTRDGRLAWGELLAAAAIVGATVALCLGAPLVAVTLLASSMLRRHLAREGEGRWVRKAVAVTLVGWSALAIMLIRARLSPFLNQGDPDTFLKLYDVLTRAQYDVAGLWPRRAPFWLQLGNIVQYADWQVALGLWNDVTPSWMRTPFTVLTLALGGVGARAHWREDRSTARAATLLLLSATVGVCVQLNLRAGPSYGAGILADGVPHEARERDYFFLLAFWLWGLWLGVGAWAVSTFLARASSLAQRLVWMVPLLLIVGNWPALDRRREPDRSIATVMSGVLLEDVPRNGMLFTAGDNDSYPLWYRQGVDAVRPDVQVVVMSLLPANWYLKEMVWRSDGLAVDTTVPRTVLARAARFAQLHLDRRGAVAVSAAVESDTRDALARAAGITCWRRVGLVDIGSRSPICPPRVHLERAVRADARLTPVLRHRARQSTDGTVEAFRELARCPGVSARAGLNAESAADSATRRLLDITCNLR